MTTDSTTNRFALVLAALTVAYGTVFWLCTGQAQLIAFLFWVLVILSAAVLFRVRRSSILAGLSLVLAVGAVVSTAASALAWTPWGIGGFAP